MTSKASTRFECVGQRGSNDPGQSEHEMILLGIDDTDIIDSPGTNQLCRHLIAVLQPVARTQRIVRHQLLVDDRVPYTSQNGSASMWLEPHTSLSVAQLAELLEPEVIAWSPEGSDPGLCIALGEVSAAIRQYGRDCQTTLQIQQQVLELAAREGLYLQGLGGTRGGIIGALAAVGLAADGNDGRLVYLQQEEDAPLASGWHNFDELQPAGIDEVRCHTTGAQVNAGRIDIGKKLRPNLLNRRVVLFVEPAEESSDAGPCWRAVKVR